jgi:hypothetical protein
MRGALAFVPTMMLLTGACDRQVEEGPWRSPIPFDTTVAWVHTGSDSTELLLELAESDSQHQFGMMTRPSVDAESGMAFLYDSVQPGENGFWMFRTIVPLDIAFLDSAGVIQAVLSMDPCPSPYPEGCPTYAPGVDYWTAVEVNRGWFARHGVGVGSRIEMPDSVMPRAGPPTGS